MQLTLIKNNNKGFTLIESMICIFLVSISLLSITKMQVGSLKGNRLAMDIMYASLESSAAADQLMCSNFNNSTLLTTGDHTYNGSNPNFITQYTVQDIQLYSSETFKLITMTTTWVQGGQQHSINNTFTKLNNI
jgi:prepilin-type N-terminal cleavage/methylation domain-containing protein